MKTRIILAIALAATSVLAGPEHLIKQKAKDVRDQSNARQGVPPRPATTPPAPAIQRPTGVQIVSTPAQQSLARFQADLAAIKQGSSLDAPAKQKIISDLLGAAQSTRPGPGTADRFITSIHKAFAAKPLPATARAKLVMNIDAVLNPLKYPQAKMDAIFDDIRSIFQNNGADVVLAADIAATARLMAAEVRK